MKLTPDKPLSVALGAGGVRGLAHIGVLEVLAERGFHISEMVGTSVGALILAYYAAVGLDLPELRRLGLSMTSRHLLNWAWLRRAPASVFHRFAHRAGTIPKSIQLLHAVSQTMDCHELHHGVERIGVLCYDLRRREEVFFHNLLEGFPLEDATRGAAAIPGFFPSRKCVSGGRVMRLVDGGVTNRLPVNYLFTPPFAPSQILAVDISNTPRIRAENAAKVERLRRAHPDIPIEVLAPDTLGKGTVIYHERDLQALIDAGRASALRSFVVPLSDLP